jgi:hypothetical protein
MVGKATTTKKKTPRAETHANKAGISIVRTRKTALAEMVITNKIKSLTTTYPSEKRI